MERVHPALLRPGPGERRLRPRTLDLLDRIPGLYQAFFSMPALVRKPVQAPAQRYEKGCQRETFTSKVKLALAGSSKKR
jgi:hypothetical protein